MYPRAKNEGEHTVARTKLSLSSQRVDVQRTSSRLSVLRPADRGDHVAHVPDTVRHRRWHLARHDGREVEMVTAASRRHDVPAPAARRGWAHTGALEQRRRGRAQVPPGRRATSVLWAQHRADTRTSTAPPWLFAVPRWRARMRREGRGNAERWRRQTEVRARTHASLPLSLVSLALPVAFALPVSLIALPFPLLALPLTLD